MLVLPADTPFSVLAPFLPGRLLLPCLDGPGHGIRDGLTLGLDGGGNFVQFRYAEDLLWWLAQSAEKRRRGVANGVAELRTSSAERTTGAAGGVIAATAISGQLCSLDRRAWQPELADS